MIKYGEVSSVDEPTRTARVIDREGGGEVLPPMKILSHLPIVTAEVKGHPEYTVEVVVKPWIPRVGQFVAYAFSETGDGFILGGG